MEQKQRQEKADWELSGGSIKPSKEVALTGSLALAPGLCVVDGFMLRWKRVNKGRFA